MGEPDSGMEEQNDANTHEQARYGFRRTTLDARPALPVLPRPRPIFANRSGSSASTADSAMEDISAIRRNLQTEDAQWTSSLPMPGVEKIASKNNPADGIGKEKPLSGQASVQPQSMSDGVLGAGSKRNLEDATDSDNTRSPKLARSGSTPRHDSESPSTALRRTVSGTSPDWHGKRTTSSPRRYDPKETEGGEGEENQEEGMEEEEEGVEGKVVEAGEEVEEDPEDLIGDGHPVNELADGSDALHQQIVITTKGVNAPLKAQKSANKPVRSSRASQDSGLDGVRNDNAKGHDSPAPVRPPQPMPSATEMQHERNDRPPTSTTSSQQMQGEGRRRQSAMLAHPAPTGNHTRRPPGHHSRAAKGLRRLLQNPITTVGEAERTTSHSRSKPSIKNLPADISMQKWNVWVIPKFLRKFACSDQPWNTECRSFAQAVWNEAFPGSPCSLTAKGDQIYPILRQHIYDFRSKFADRAERAVEDFFRKYPRFADPRCIEKYVEFAVPPAQIKKGKNGKAIMVEEDIFPYMYKYSDEHEMDANKDEFRGAFQHECILNTLAHYLEVIDHMPAPTVDIQKPPRSALALAAVAVERALKQWSHGTLLPNGGPFAEKEWGAETYDVMTAINDCSEAKWERIITGASQYVWKYNTPGASKANFTTRILCKRLSGRATILSSDDEDSDAGVGSDDANQ